MRKPVPTFVAGLIASVLGAAALTAQDRVDLAMVARVRAEATERSKVLETFNFITNVVGARPSGGRAHKQAADYVRETGVGHDECSPGGVSAPRGWELESSARA